MTYEEAFERSQRRTAAGTPTIPQSVHGGQYWITRTVKLSSPWPSGKDGKHLLTREEAEARAKASTEAGRPQVVIPARSGGYRVRDVALSSPVKRRYTKSNVKLSEHKVIEAKIDYTRGRFSMRTLAKQLGVGKSTLQQAIHGMTWADVA